MKKLRIVLLTVAVILIAAGAAFATNTSKNAADDTVPGYYIDYATGQCLNAFKPCTTVVGPMCTWHDTSTGNDYNLRRQVDTSCGDYLYEIVNP
jgi:hypothetical protein